MPFFAKTGARWELKGFILVSGLRLGISNCSPLAIRLFRQKYILARKFLEDRGILRKVGGKDVDRVSGVIVKLKPIDHLVLCLTSDAEE